MPPRRRPVSGGVVLQLALDTLATAGVYALFALAVQAAWAGSGVLHLAVGDVAMTGAVVAGALVSDGLPAPLALIAGLVVGAVVSTAMERALVRPLGSRVALGAATLVAGGACLRQALGAGFTRAAYPLPVVPGRWTVGGGVLRGADLVAAGVAAAVAVTAGLALHRSRAGAALRVTAASAEAAETLGVDTRRVRALAFGLAGTLAVAAAALSAGRVVPAPAAGTAPGLKGLAAAVAAGAGAPGLACAAAVVVGAVEVVGSYLWGGAGEVAAAGVAIALVAGRWRP